jgi:hypothetical protein
MGKPTHTMSGDAPPPHPINPVRAPIVDAGLAVHALRTGIVSAHGLGAWFAPSRGDATLIMI